MSSGSSERLREALLDAEEARRREAWQRQVAECLLEGLRAVVMTTNVTELFPNLFEVLREPLGFEHALVLSKGKAGAFTAVAGSAAWLQATTWRPAKLFTRALSGRPVAVFDTSKVAEWADQPEEVRQASRSALLFAIRGRRANSLFMCVHPSRARFTQEHAGLAGRFAVLAGQAMQKLELEVKMADMQERLKAQATIVALGQQLQKAHSYITNIINSMPSVLVGVNVDGKVTHFNTQAEQMTGLSEDEVLGLPLAQAVPQLGVEPAQVRQAIVSRRKQHVSRRLRLHNGERRYEDVTIFPLISNSVEGAVILVDDVTERVRIEEMMVQSEKMLSVGGLAAGMGHEINNPLAGIMQTAEVLSYRLTCYDLPANIKAAKEAGAPIEAIQAYMEKRKVIEMLDRIRQAGNRAAAIVAQMLSFAAKSAASWSSRSLPELLDECVGLAGSDYDLMTQCSFRQIEIVREYEEDLPLVPCEAGKIRQVLLNILKNGAEAMQHNVAQPPRFILRLLHDRAEGMVRIEIEDNGPGMDETTRKRAFEPFFTTKPTDRGKGLGLSVSYFIITEDHGGELSVESTPGEGTKLIIRLPVQRRGTTDRPS